MTGLVLLVAPVLGIGTHVVSRDHLPDRIPEPWDWTGGHLSDGTDPDEFLGAQSLSIALVTVSFVATAVSSGGGRSRTWIAGPAVGVAMSSFLWMKSEIISAGAPELAAVQPRAWQTLLTWIAMFTYMWLLHSVLPLAPRPVMPPYASQLTFPPGLRVLWVDSARSPLKLWLTLALVAAAVGAAVVSTSAAVAVLVCAGWFAWSYLVRVRITDDGVEFTRFVGWPFTPCPCTPSSGPAHGASSDPPSRERSRTRSTTSSTGGRSSSAPATWSSSRPPITSRCISASTMRTRRPTSSTRSSSEPDAPRSRRANTQSSRVATLGQGDTLRADCSRQGL